MKVLAILAALVCVLNIITFLDDAALMQLFGLLLVFPMLVLYVESRKGGK